MTLDEYTEFIFGAVLLDWDAEGAKMQRIASVFDAADEVRIVGDGTDLTLSLAGRSGAIDDGHINMPGGEVFYSPVEDSVEGEITFSEFPAVYYGHEVAGARFVFEAGEIVEASARSGEEFLLRRSTPTRAPAGSASSGSAATRASSASRRTSASTRRSTARSTSRSATRTRPQAART